jgi:hypothetical protein
MNLGVGLRGSGTVPIVAANGMELAFTISGHRHGMEYDIKRTRSDSLWQRAGGKWTSWESHPMGTGDDPPPDGDECLRLGKSNRIFAIDTPGWYNAGLPIPAGFRPVGLSGVRASAAATELVQRFSFAEWVIARNRVEGLPWTPLQLPLRNGKPRSYIFWRSTTWLIRNPPGDPTGNWVLGPRSAIERGSLLAKVIDSAPA